MTADYQNSQNLDYYKSRLNSLEAENNILSREMDMKDLEWTSNSFESVRKLNFIKNDLANLKEELLEIKKLFIDIVYRLRLKIDNEDYLKIKKRVDSIEYEKYITRNEFERLMK
jgi:hypothetical protein